MSDYLDRLRHLSKQLAEPGVAPNVHTNVSFIKLLSHAERLEQQRNADQTAIIKVLNEHYKAMQGTNRLFNLRDAIQAVNEHFEADTWTTY